MNMKYFFYVSREYSANIGTEKQFKGVNTEAVELSVRDDEGSTLNSF